MMTGWKLFWYQVKCICRKEFLAIMKDKAFRRILVIPVIFTGILFGYAATFNVTYISYGVLDQSHSEASASLLARLDGTGFFHRAATLQNASQIAAIMDTEQAMMVLAIPQDFTQRLERGENYGMAALVQAYHYVYAAFLQVQGMGMTLAAIADYRYGFTL